jgi:hypothetical protein
LAYAAVELTRVDWNPQDGLSVRQAGTLHAIHRESFFLREVSALFLRPFD